MPDLKVSAMAKPTSEVKISLDYGNCWRTVPLEVALFVDNIRSVDRAVGGWMWLGQLIVVPVQCVEFNRAQPRASALPA